MLNILSSYRAGDMVIRYVEKAGRVGLQLAPATLAWALAADFDCAVEPLIQLKRLGDPFAGAFGCGVTLRDSASVDLMVYRGQRMKKEGEGFTVESLFLLDGLRLTHSLTWRAGCPQVLGLAARVENLGGEKQTLELLSSFALGTITPFAPGLNPGGLKIYAMRSRWANEAVLQAHTAEELLLVPSTLKEEIYAYKYGHIGSKPTNGHIPFVAVEDTARGVMWGASLFLASSWQIELARRDEGLSLSGGLADADFGAWMKELAPGTAFDSPTAYVTVCEGDIDDLCDRLVSAQCPPMAQLPPGEEDLPVTFNEWCTSWGCPDEKNMRRLLERLKGWPVRYLVMDAGWYKDGEGDWSQYTGDWLPSRQKYPQGLKAVCDSIRAAGFVPGLWFELETCGSRSQIYSRGDWLLTRHGRPLIAGQRRFLDFRNPQVWDYLCRRVIGLMKECGIGYIKVDSNDSAGLGCDGAESLGEGLRADILRVEEFFREMRRQIPDLVIENCSSGGHRLVGNFMAVASMASFSDAFESDDIPIIAANLHRVILPRQSQVWCIVRKTDDARRLHYKLASGFLGRIGLSGDVYDLNEDQLAILREALDRYAQAAEVIRNGFSRRYGPRVDNYRAPQGWQALVRCEREGERILVVAHSFEGFTASALSLPLPGADYRPEWAFAQPRAQARVVGSQLRLDLPGPMEGAVVMLRREGTMPRRRR